MYVMLEGFVDTRGKFALAWDIESPSGKAATPTPSKGHTIVKRSSGASGRHDAPAGAALAGLATAFACAVLVHLWGPGLLLPLLG